jgi:hypothetical protein
VKNAWKRAESPASSARFVRGNAFNGTNLQPRKSPRTRGSKLCGQKDIPKTLANIMTRALANNYNEFVTNRRDLPNDKFSNERNEKDKKRASTEHLD